MDHQREPANSGRGIKPSCGNWNSSATNMEPTLPSSSKLLNQDETERLLEFLSANICNPNTRLAYVRAVRDFFRWTEARGLTLSAIRPIHIAAYIEGLSGAPSSAKQKLAAVRMLFDWLVTGGVLPTNPTAALYGPRHVVKVGKTSVLTAQEARTLLNSSLFDNGIATRDRALIGTMYDQRRLNIWKQFWGG
jgi:site-specific recombinase XerD